STQYLASFGGSVLGAVLISWLGIPLLVSLTAVNYFISAMIELTIDFPASSDDLLVDSAESESENTDQTPAQELDWHKFPLLRLLLAGFGLVNFFATPILVVIPLYVQKSLHAEADILGWLEASLWIGILLGTFAAAIIKTDGRTIRMGAVSMVIYGLCLFIPGLFINFYAFALALFGAGVSLGVNNVKFVTLFQKVVPNEVKGRFFAAMQAIISFSFPVAYLIFGYLGDILPPDQVCLIQGCGILLVAAWFYHLSRRESELHS
ncbi:MAG: MFS transporter, partial [Erysipelotrichia bacterium]|nr:MFS transporter [Erysipelotrichia bacterium]